MALPTLNKTWQISPSVVAGDGTPNDNEHDTSNFLRVFKDTLKSFASNPWTVVSSCAYVGGATWTASASDLWTADNEIEFSQYQASEDYVGNRAWIVLKQASVGSGNFQMLIDCNSSQQYGWDVRIFFSPSAGFTGGDTTHRPTATDEVYYGAWESPSFYGTGRLHVWMSSDGECTRAAFYKDNLHLFWFAVDTPKSPQSGWSSPFMFCWRSDSQTAGQSLYSDLNSNPSYRNEYGTMYLTAEGAGANPTGTNFQLPDDVLTAQKAIYPQGIASETYGWRGTRKGQMYDQYWFTGSSDKELVPDDGSAQFIVIGDLLLPWDGSVPLWS